MPVEKFFILAVEFILGALHLGIVFLPQVGHTALGNGVAGHRLQGRLVAEIAKLQLLCIGQQRQNCQHQEKKQFFHIFTM